jgi:catechol 2,3-dioxygenase-like lactoylglutathione lyase family enzyme
MEIRLSHCNLLVRDQDEALSFYRDVLGLEVRMDMPFGEGRWVTLAPSGQPDIEIILETPHTGDAADDKDALLSLMAKYVLNTLIFVTDDCDATFEQVRSAGAQVTQEPTDQPYGVRDCAFRDPSGNQVRISQPLST